MPAPHTPPRRRTAGPQDRKTEGHKTKGEEKMTSRAADQVQELMDQHMFEVHVPAHTSRGRQDGDALLRRPGVPGPAHPAARTPWAGPSPPCTRTEAGMTLFLRTNGRMEGADRASYERTMALWQSDTAVVWSYPVPREEDATPVPWKYRPMNPGETPGYEEMTGLHSWEKPRARTGRANPNAEISKCRTCRAGMVRIPGGPDGRDMVMLELPGRTECYYAAGPDGRMLPARDAEFYGREPYRRTHLPDLTETD